MTRWLARLLTLLTLAAASPLAWAAGGPPGSTIDPAIPVTGSPLSSSVMRGQFQAAVNDINHLMSQFMGAIPPVSPLLFQNWCNTGVNPYVCSLWDGASWAVYGSLNPSNHTFQTAPVTSDIGGTASPLSTRFAQEINVVTDESGGTPLAARQFTDAVMTASSNNVNSVSTTFTTADVGKQISVTGVGACSGFGCVPGIGTIVSRVDSHNVVVSFTATTAAPWVQSWLATVVTPQSGGGSYAPGDTFTAVGGTGVVTPAAYSVGFTVVSSATVNNGGTGGTPGACTFTGTTGTPLGGGFTVFKATGTINGSGVLTGALTVTVSGFYAANPASISAEPVTGCGLTGATFALKMGVGGVVVTNPGRYTTLPSSPVATTATSGSGTGATISMLSTQGGGTGAYGNDASPAIAAAITKMMSLAGTQQPVCVHIPAGAYFLKSTTLPTMGTGGCVRGDGGTTTGTILMVDPSYVGDVFSWSNAWLLNQNPFAGQTGIPTLLQAGPRLTGVMIMGNRLTSARQNAMMFYDHADLPYVEDVSVWYMRGCGLCMGVLKNDTSSYTREGQFSRLRFYNSGDTNVPSLQDAITGGGSTNDMRYSQVEIYASYGPGLSIWADNGTVLGTRHFSQLRVEGLEGGPGPAGDLIQIGDPAKTGRVSQVAFDEVQLTDPISGYAALHFMGPSLAGAPAQISFTNSVIAGGLAYGKGIVIDAGQLLDLNFQDIHTFDTNVTVGANTTVGSGIKISGNGLEQTWSWSVDSTSVSKIKTPIYKYGVPNSSTSTTEPAVAATYHDGSVLGGNALGAGAVDLQTDRNDPTQAATGNTSVICGGAFNLASGPVSIACGGAFNHTTGNSASALGGSSNLADGDFSRVGGIQDSTHGLYGADSWSSGQNSNAYDNDYLKVLLRCTTSNTSACTMTADGNAAGSVNVANLPVRTGAALFVTLTATDASTTGTNYMASWTAHLYTKDNGPSSTLIDGVSTAIAADSTRSRGTVTGLAVSLTADTTNGGLALVFTPPTGNTDNWHASAVVELKPETH